MKIVKFDNTYFEPFVTEKEVTVELVIKYLKCNYNIDFEPDPDFEYQMYNDKVYNKTDNCFLYYHEDFIDVM